MADAIKWDDEAIQWDDDAPALWRAAKNIPGGAANLVRGIYEMVTSPVQTVKGAADAAAGGLRNLAPESLRQFLDKADTPETTARISNTADAFGEHYKNRLGSWDAIKRTAIEDPVGLAADVSTLFTGVGGLTKLAPAVSKAAMTAAKYTNPLSVVAPVGLAAGSVAKNILGSPAFTGIGPEAVSQAFKAGVKGGTPFLDNIHGKVSFANVLDDARAGIAKMREDRGAAYRQNMAAVKSDATVLKLDGVDQALSDAAGTVAYKGVVKNPNAAAALAKVAEDVAEWKKLDPRQFHTPEGLDALKQRIGSTLESLPFEDRSSRLAVGKVYAAVTAEINKQAPTYAKTMKAYEEASDLLKEIESALSLKKQASADTAMRKLQSLMRNNANTNYGNRLDLANDLVEKGGRDIMPALAGQAASSWSPRGLGWIGGSVPSIGLAAATTNPAYLAALPMQSPKLVGLGAYGAGSAGRGLLNLGLTPERLVLGGLLGSELGRDY